MFLSGKAIQQEIDKGHIIIRPEAIIKEASIKIHLSGEFAAEKEHFIRYDNYELSAKGFILAKSKETIELPDNLLGLYDGCFGVSSKGIQTHMGSMLFDPGFRGSLTLEIFNASDISVVLTKDLYVGNLLIARIEV